MGALAGASPVQVVGSVDSAGRPVLASRSRSRSWPSPCAHCYRPRHDREHPHLGDHRPAAGVRRRRAGAREGRRHVRPQAPLPPRHGRPVVLRRRVRPWRGEPRFVDRHPVLGGLEGAATGAASMAIVMRVFDRGDRVKAMGWWSLVGAGGPVSASCSAGSCSKSSAGACCSCAGADDRAGLVLGSSSSPRRSVATQKFDIAGAATLGAASPRCCSRSTAGLRSAGATASVIRSCCAQCCSFGSCGSSYAATRR